MSKEILLTNIQRFSLHDGPGIRTTVFLKGCSLRCPWCSNPENLKPSPEPYMKDGVSGIYGKYMDPEALIRECLKDKGFYEGSLSRDQWKISSAEQIDKLPGGVTFSGGECLLQMDRLTPVIERLHEENVHVAVETALFVSPRMVELAIQHIDFFYVDMKILRPDRCKEVEKGDLKLYLENLNTLLSEEDEKRIPVVIRVPVIGEYTDDPMNREAVKKLLTKHRNGILKVELIKEHNLGELKYNSLGMNTDYHGVEDGMMERYKAEIEDVGLPVEICRI